MALKADDIRKKENETTGSEELSIKIIESIAGLNKNVSSLAKDYSDLLAHIDKAINTIDHHNTNADKIINQVSNEQQTIQDTIRVETRKVMRESLRQIDKEIKSISQSARRQIDTYTEESRHKRDMYEKSRTSDKFLTWFNIGFLIINIVIIIYFL